MAPEGPVWSDEHGQVELTLKSAEGMPATAVLVVYYPMDDVYRVLHQASGVAIDVPAYDLRKEVPAGAAWEVKVAAARRLAGATAARIIIANTMEMALKGVLYGPPDGRDQTTQ